MYLFSLRFPRPLRWTISIFRINCRGKQMVYPLPNQTKPNQTKPNQINEVLSLLVLHKDAFSGTRCQGRRLFLFWQGGCLSPAGGGVGGGVALLRGWEFERRHNLQLRKKRSHVGRALPAAVNLMEIITQRHRAAKNKKEWNIKNN